MDVENMILTVREDLLDDTVEPYLWSDVKILRWLNRAQEEACLRQRLLVDETTSAITDITLVSSQGSYALDPRIVLVDRVVYDQKTIPKTTKARLDSTQPGWRELEPGEPLFYLQNDLTIRLIPTPGPGEDSETLTIRASRLPLVDLEDEQDIPEIPSPHHENLCYYAAARAFLLPDEDTQNPNLAGMYMQKFDLAFGPALSADVLAHKRRETNVSYVTSGHAYHGRRTTGMSPDRAFDYE